MRATFVVSRLPSALNTVIDYIDECGMTSWLRDSPLRVSLGRRRAPSPLHDVDPAAAFHSFIKHWQQTCEIFSRTRLRGEVSADDVTAVINHLAQMVTLLLVDLKQIKTHSARNQNGIPQKVSTGVNGRDATIGNPLEDIQEVNSQHSSLPAEDPPHTPIFDHFVGEEILDTILTWSLNTGEFVNALKLEQLKVHEQLLSHSRQEILVYKPIICPLMRLLASCGGCVPVEVEKRLVVLLNQLCVSLMHNHHLLDFFFQFSNDQGPAKFVIFSLLLPFVHREGGIGQQARDALLLCMALSASHTSVGQYIAQHSNFCPVLAAGLSGLYSMLPRSLSVESDGWHRLCMEDIADISQLQLFLNSLEFCNAVVQVAHPLVRKQLVEFLYQGFLVPVLGPALHQGDAVNGDIEAHNTPVFLSVVGEVVAATAYVELCLRTVTEPELRRVFLAFLLVSPNSPALEPPIISILISRLHSPNTQLCLVTLSLFWTLVELNCEDLMVALVFQYLTPCTHVMLSQRSRLTQPPDPAAKSSLRLVHLIPDVCQAENSQKQPEVLEPSRTQYSSTTPQSSPTTFLVPRHQRSLSNASTCSSESDLMSLDQPTTYSYYLNEAQMSIAACKGACSCWAWRYDGLNPSPTQAVEMLDAARLNPPVLYPKLRSHSDPTTSQSSDASQAEARIRSTSLPSDVRTKLAGLEETLREIDQAFTSFKIYDVSLSKSYNKVYRLEITGDEGEWVGPPWHSHEPSPEVAEKAAASESQPRPTIGPFLEALMLRIDQMLSSSIHVNLLVMTIMSRLATYPTPLLSSLLLDTSIVFQPSVRSLVQVISGLKQRIDSLLTSEDTPLLAEARTWFVRRLIVPRFSPSTPRTRSVSSSSTDTPLVRGEGKRRSISQTMTALFRRTTNSERPTIKESPLEDLPDKSGYRYIKRSSLASVDTGASSCPGGEKHHAARCAVLLRDWLLELSALAQEQMVAVPSLEFRFPSS
ncbi:FHF complex subunit HOOK-interacting protein 1B isoform X5 [Procambarus clarkii]|uniref:FHF complex subunit HOOK-interacting protein 1B isoform X5 n=1 Tax=Procambarus clarkii TaxID=6728 RepID=UPI0037445A4D